MNDDTLLACSFAFLLGVVAGSLHWWLPMVRLWMGVWP